MQTQPYDEIDAVNWSALRYMRISPKHYLAASQTERADTDSFRLGRATHTCTLEPDRFPLEYVLFTGNKVKEPKVWAAFKELNQDKTILSLAQYETACRIRDSVRSNPLVQPLLAEGKPEQVLTWTDPATGIKLKGRADLVLPNGIWDLKTSRHAINLRRFTAAAWELGYYHQVAFYSRHPMFVADPDAGFITVEPTPPHDSAVLRLDSNAVWAANRDIDKLLAQLAECLNRDRWPGVFDSVQTIEEPPFAFKSLDDEEQEEAA